MIENVGAAADLAADKATFADNAVGAPDRADRDPYIEGEIALGRQLRTRGQGAVADRLFDLVGDARVKRPVALLNVGKPSCHSDNSLYCATFHVNYLYGSRCNASNGDDNGCN